MAQKSSMSGASWFMFLCFHSISVILDHPIDVNDHVLRTPPVPVAMYLPCALIVSQKQRRGAFTTASVCLICLITAAISASSHTRYSSHGLLLSISVFSNSFHSRYVWRAAGHRRVQDKKVNFGASSSTHRVPYDSGSPNCSAEKS